MPARTIGEHPAGGKPAQPVREDNDTVLGGSTCTQSCPRASTGQATRGGGVDSALGPSVRNLRDRIDSKAVPGHTLLCWALPRFGMPDMLQLLREAISREQSLYPAWP